MSTEAKFVGPPFADDLFNRLLALNNLNASELSFKTREDFLVLLDAASHVRAEAGGLALIVAFSEDCNYDSANFIWHRERYRRFNYIDRVVVSDAARGQGLARRLYQALETRTRLDGRERLVCEIYAEPANPVSDAFHQALGFEPVGEQYLEDRGKTVRYWVKELA